MCSNYVEITAPQEIFSTEFYHYYFKFRSVGDIQYSSFLAYIFHMPFATALD